MLQTIRSLLGLKPAPNFKLLMQHQAIIIDVRSKAEYNNGHINTAINIPVNQIDEALYKFDKNQIIITCCASGIRSVAAKNILIEKGFTQVYNGGGWRRLQSKL